MNMDSFLKPLLEAGGTLAVAAIFLYYIDRQDRRVNTLICNHLQHSTDALEKVAKSLTQLTTVIKNLQKK